jgi:hypothetical protein
VTGSRHQIKRGKARHNIAWLTTLDPMVFCRPSE